MTAQCGPSATYKGGPNSVSKNHISFRCKNEPKTSLLYLLVLIMTIFPFYYVDASLQSRRLRGSPRPGRGHSSDTNVLAKTKLMGTRNYNIIVEVPARLNSWCLCCLARILSRSWRKGTASRLWKLQQTQKNYRMKQSWRQASMQVLNSSVARP